MSSYVQEVYSILMEGHKEWADSEMESDKPAEVFDAHPISAMKVSDGDLPGDEETMTITDTWKPEWQRGVQVPVNPPTEFPQTVVKTINLPGDRKRPRFSLPGDLLRCSKDAAENDEDSDEPAVKYHRVHLEEMFAGVCRYDVDLLDSAWISVVNEERKCLRQRLVEESMVEYVVEALEILTHDKLQDAQRQVKDAGKGGLEYDETVMCDVCKEPDGEDGNEMVFCDGCDVCVHQACYGILKIPDGNWLCRPCSLGFKAACALCPKSGGALKPARDGARWCHVSCALWIPEVGFGDVEKMEPITKMTDIPPARWSLVCCLCRDRVGACIQCAVKSCKIAFHVTCGHDNNLTMQQILTGDDVRMMAYCPRHSTSPKSGKHSNRLDGANTSTSNTGADSEFGSGSIAGKPFAELEASFHTLVSLEELQSHLSSNSHNIPADICQLVHDYWKLKRRAAGNQPLLKVGERPPVIDEEHARLVARMQMFITLRHDLERARNLCYMILRREKMKRSRFRVHENLVKSVCRHVKKNVKTLTSTDMKELSGMPFFNDDIYDSGSTFASRTLVYARACPEQELMTRQELSRLQEQTSKSKRRNSDTSFSSTFDSKLSKGVKLEQKSSDGVGRPVSGKAGNIAASERVPSIFMKIEDGKVKISPSKVKSMDDDMDSSQVEFSELDDSWVSGPSKVKPKRRGRPPLSETRAAQNDTSYGSVEVKARKRGRPSMNDSMLESNYEDDASEVATGKFKPKRRMNSEGESIEKPKRGRGRPPLLRESIGTDPMDDGDVDSLDSSVIAAEPAKRGRGRRPLRESIGAEPMDDGDVDSLDSSVITVEPVKRGRGRPSLKRKHSERDDQATTEWVSMGDLFDIVSPSPMDKIPRDQLVVSCDLKDRLRSGLMRRQYRGLIRSAGGASTSGAPSPSILHDTSISHNTKNIFDRLLSTQL